MTTTPATSAESICQTLSPDGGDASDEPPVPDDPVLTVSHFFGPPPARDRPPTGDGPEGGATDLPGRTPGLHEPPGGAGAPGHPRRRHPAPGWAETRERPGAGPEGPRREPGRGRAGAGGGAPAPRRRGPADPVRAVLHQHRDLVGTATDPWEIAAALEAQGVTDADARRLRHRDVFGLADELFARAPGTLAAAPPPPPPGRRPAVLAAAPYLLPAAAAALAPRPLAAAALVATAFAVTRRGPLRAAAGAGAAPALWTCALLALTLPRADRVALTALGLSLVPAALCAQWFAAGARALLDRSRGLADFAAALRPRLAAALAAYTAVLLAMLLPPALLAAPAGHRPADALTAAAVPACLGLLLFAGRLTAVHGRPPGAPPAVLAAACAAEGLRELAAALGLAPAGGAGADAVRAAVCAAAALAVLARALRTLTRPSAHRGPERRACAHRPPPDRPASRGASARSSTPT